MAAILFIYIFIKLKQVTQLVEHGTYSSLELWAGSGVRTDFGRRPVGGRLESFWVMSSWYLQLNNGRPFVSRSHSECTDGRTCLQNSQSTTALHTRSYHLSRQRIKRSINVSLWQLETFPPSSACLRSQCTIWCRFELEQWHTKHNALHKTVMEPQQ